MKLRMFFSVTLTCAMLLLCVLPVFADYTPYDAAMPYGVICAKYESGGSPARISGGADAGGKSYGAYQFASASDVPKTFANWCVSSGANASVGNALLFTYKQDGNTYGTKFDAEWKRIGETYPDAFLALQYSYTKLQYYDNTVAQIKASVGLDVEARGLALKNAVFARAVQHGSTGCVNRFKSIATGRTLSALNDLDIIRLLYIECSAVVDTPPYENSKVIHASEVSNTELKKIIADYGLEGKYLKYYSRNEGYIQVSVFRRLRVNELNDLIAMYQNEYPYHDVNVGAWYFPYVKYAVDNKLMNGTSGSTFAPNDATVRAMVVTILWRLNSKPAATAGIPFTDVPAGSYYTDATKWAYNAKIVTGTGADTFSPSRNMTREEMITLFYRYASSLGKDVSQKADLSAFVDSGSIDGWATDAMRWSVGCGMISGTQDGKLNPLGNASRAETATMFKRFIEIYNLQLPA